MTLNEHTATDATLCLLPPYPDLQQKLMNSYNKTHLAPCNVVTSTWAPRRRGGEACAKPPGLNLCLRTRLKQPIKRGKRPVKHDFGLGGWITALVLFTAPIIHLACWFIIAEPGIWEGGDIRWDPKGSVRVCVCVCVHRFQVGVGGGGVTGLGIYNEGVGVLRACRRRLVLTPPAESPQRVIERSSTVL